MQKSLHSKRFRNPVRRILMLLAGIECATFGISCTALSGLGTTPISSLPFVLSKIFPLTFGTTTFILNVFFVLIEAMLLRSRFTVMNLLQIPAVLVFGLFIDLNMMLLGAHAPDDWVMGLAMSVGGSVVLAVGVFLQIRSKTIVQPGEGVVIVYAAVLRKSFGTMKVVNDVALVICRDSLACSPRHDYGHPGRHCNLRVSRGLSCKRHFAFLPGTESRRPASG